MRKFFTVQKGGPSKIGGPVRPNSSNIPKAGPVLMHSLTQTLMFTMCNAALTHVEILRLRAVTELNNDGMIKFVDVHYQ